MDAKKSSLRVKDITKIYKRSDSHLDTKEYGTGQWTVLRRLPIKKGKNDVLKWKGVTESLCSIVG